MSTDELFKEITSRDKWYFPLMSKQRAYGIKRRYESGELRGANLEDFFAMFGYKRTVEHWELTNPDEFKNRAMLVIHSLKKDEPALISYQKKSPKKGRPIQVVDLGTNEIMQFLSITHCAQFFKCPNEVLYPFINSKKLFRDNFIVMSKAKERAITAAA